jgi:hypothetical protein
VSVKKAIVFSLLVVINLWMIIFQNIPCLIESRGSRGWFLFGLSMAAVILCSVSLGFSLLGGGY